MRWIRPLPPLCYREYERPTRTPAFKRLRAQLIIAKLDRDTATLDELAALLQSSTPDPTC